MEYVTKYTPSLLKSIPRNEQRQSLGITEDGLPFTGLDIWNAFEFSWLNAKGRPEVGMAQFQVPVKSANLIESKSLKLYLRFLMPKVGGASMPEFNFRHLMPLSLSDLA